MKLNNSQKEFFDLVMTADEGSKFVLEGKAGTGKTFTVSQIVNRFIEDGKKVLCVAPTHAAKNNLKTIIDLPEVQVETVAKILSYRPFTNVYGDVTFGSPSGLSGRSEDLLIVDEKGMVPEKQVALLNQFPGIIIYTGDDSQLRPVKGKQSQFTDCQRFVLTEQMRCATEIEQIAERTLNSSEPYFPQSDITNRAELIRQMLVTGVEDSVYLCYRNEVADEVNIHVRAMLYPKAETFIIGEKLLARFNSDSVKNNEIFTITDCVQIDEEDWLIEVNRSEFILTKSPAKMRDYLRHLDKMKERAETFKKQGNIDAYNQLIDDVFKKRAEYCEVNYPFASTVHKAQGRTVKNVFVDTLDVKSASDRNRLLYVAYSRASNNLFTINIPEPRIEVIRRFFKKIRERFSTRKLVARKGCESWGINRILSYIKEKANYSMTLTELTQICPALCYDNNTRSFDDIR
jgi:exodeoxyribonuclease-5